MLNVFAVRLPKLGFALGEYRSRVKLGLNARPGHNWLRATRAVLRAWSTRATAAWSC